MRDPYEDWDDDREELTFELDDELEFDAPELPDTDFSLDDEFGPDSGYFG